MKIIFLIWTVFFFQLNLISQDIHNNLMAEYMSSRKGSDVLMLIKSCENENIYLIELYWLTENIYNDFYKNQFNSLKSFLYLIISGQFCFDSVDISKMIPYKVKLTNIPDRIRKLSTSELIEKYTRPGENHRYITNLFGDEIMYYICYRLIKENYIIEFDEYAGIWCMTHISEKF